jgi:hypothetical protein
MDFYQTLASQIFEVPEDQVTPQQRQKVKHGLFLTMYEGKRRGQEFLDKILGQFISDSKHYIGIRKGPSSDTL